MTSFYFDFNFLPKYHIFEMLKNISYLYVKTLLYSLTYVYQALSIKLSYFCEPFPFQHINIHSFSQISKFFKNDRKSSYIIWIIKLKSYFSIFIFKTNIFITLLLRRHAHIDY